MGKLLKQHNEMVVAPFQGSAIQQKALAFVFDHLVENEFNEKLWDKPLEVNLADLMPEGCSMGGIQRKQIREELKQITKTQIFYVDQDGCDVWYAPICHVKHTPKTNKVMLHVTTSFVCTANDMYRKGYTKLPHDELRELSGRHAVKLYTILKQAQEYARVQHKKYGECSFSIPEFYQILGIDEKSYSTNFKDFRNWVILPAEEEIKVKTKLSFEITYARGKGRGKPYTGVSFTAIYHNDAPILDPTLEIKVPTNEDKCAAVLTSYGFNGSLIVQNMEAFGFQEYQTVDFAHFCGDKLQSRQAKTDLGKINVPTPWLITSLGDFVREFIAKPRKPKSMVKAPKRSTESDITPENRKEAQIRRETLAEYELLPEEVKEAVKRHKTSPEGGSMMFWNDETVYSAIKNRLQLDLSTGKYSVQLDLLEVPTKGMKTK
jgi:hypothetical protein